MDCPDENDLLAYVEGHGSGAQRASVERHLEDCEGCLSIVASVVADDEPATRSLPDDRYTSRTLIGSGASGVVYRAFDERLRRPVALKLVSLPPASSQADLFAEARVLASISHPNIVTVHDAGLQDGRLAVVMELVEGSDLGSWLKGPGRRTRWPHRLALMLAAGRGLAAVHHAGVVHGDFKPANLLLGIDDRVRVADFGMSSLTARGCSHADHGWGTPRYMAPERFREDATVSADIYAFCASTYEALYLAPAFEARSLEALYVAKTQGPPAAPPGGHGVPGFVHRAIARGLSPDSQRRWASMDELLTVLARAEMSRWPWVASTAISIGLGATAVAWAGDEDDKGCDEASSPINGVWNPAQRSGIEEAFGANPWPLSAETLEATMPRLQSYADAWASAHRTVCEAASRDELDPRAYRAQMTCLSARLYALDAATEVLSRSDPAVAEHAVSLVLSLPDVAECSRDDGQQGPEIPQGPEVAAIRRDLAEVRALLGAGLFSEAADLGQRVLADAHRLGDRRLLAETLLEVGAVSQHLEATEAAREQLEEAIWTAQAIGHPRVQIEAASLLAAVESSDADRPVDGRRWVRYARAQIARSGTSASTRAKVARQAGSVAFRSGDHEAAAEETRAGLAILDDAGVDAPSIRAGLHGNLALVLRVQGRLDEAAAEQLEALQIREALFGPRHPATARTLTNLGTTRWRQGQLAEAEALLRRAVEARATVLGPNSLDLAKSTNNLGSVLYTQGRVDEALVQFTRTLEIRRAALDESHRFVLRTRVNVALCLLDLGRLDEAVPEHLALVEAIESRPVGQREMLHNVLGNLALARQEQGQLEAAAALHQRAIDALEADAGPDHPDLGVHLTNLADLRVAQGRFEDARARYQSALELRTRVLGPEHPDLAQTLCGLASTYRSPSEAPKVMELLERAADIASSPDTPPAILGRVELGLARATLRLERDPAAAMEHALVAEGALEGLPGSVPELADAKALLAELRDAR